MSPENTAGVAPAEGIDDFQSMYGQQQTVHTWRVVNLADDGPSYEVNTLQGTCECTSNESSCCKHLAYVLSGAGQKLDVSEFLAYDLGNVVRDARDTLKDVSAVSSGQTPQPTGGQEETGQGDSGSDTDANPLDTERDPNESEKELMADVESWIESAQNFDSSIDPDIVQLEWAHLNGSEGIHIDMAPWYGSGYWDGDSWSDKDGYDRAKNALKDLLKAQDEIEYTGDPHYINFLPSQDVGEVTG